MTNNKGMCNKIVGKGAGSQIRRENVLSKEKKLSG